MPPCRDMVCTCDSRLTASIFIQFKKEQAKEHAKEAGAEHLYQVEEAKERAAADHAAAEMMRERQQVSAVQKQAHSYQADLAKEGNAEAQRQNSLEARIRMLKKQEKLHAEKMQARASAEVAASERVHAGERASADEAAKAPVAKVAVRKKVGDDQGRASAYPRKDVHKVKSSKESTKRVQDKVEKAWEPAVAQNPSKTWAREGQKAKEAVSYSLSRTSSRFVFLSHVQSVVACVKRVCVVVGCACSFHILDPAHTNLTACCRLSRVAFP